VSRFVLDASVVLTWCFPDEAASHAQIVSDRIANGDIPVVPAFWSHEVLNALLVGERRKRITADLTGAFLADLGKLPIEVGAAGEQPSVFGAVQSLCRKHGLTAYDAAYLDVALRGRLPLATVDQDLKKAALAEGLEVL
jgi:predicted nucleic acid-binding protein